MEFIETSAMRHVRTFIEHLLCVRAALGQLVRRSTRSVTVAGSGQESAGPPPPGSSSPRVPRASCVPAIMLSPGAMAVAFRILGELGRDSATTCRFGAMALSTRGPFPGADIPSGPWRTAAPGVGHSLA